MAVMRTSPDWPMRMRNVLGAWWRMILHVVGIMARNPALTSGLLLLASIVLFSAIGPIVYDTDKSAPLSVPAPRAGAPR